MPADFKATIQTYRWRCMMYTPFFVQSWTIRAHMDLKTLFRVVMKVIVYGRTKSIQLLQHIRSSHLTWLDSWKTPLQYSYRASPVGSRSTKFRSFWSPLFLLSVYEYFTSKVKELEHSNNMISSGIQVHMLKTAFQFYHKY